MWKSFLEAWNCSLQIQLLLQNLPVEKPSCFSFCNNTLLPVIVLMYLYITVHSTDKAEACDLCIYRAWSAKTTPALSVTTPAVRCWKIINSLTESSFWLLCCCRNKEHNIALHLLCLICNLNGTKCSQGCVINHMNQGKWWKNVFWCSQRIHNKLTLRFLLHLSEQRKSFLTQKYKNSWLTFLVCPLSKN